MEKEAKNNFEMHTYIPLSKEWEEKLLKDNGFLHLLEENKLETLTTEFPKNMIFPQAVLNQKDVNGYNALMLASAFGKLDKLSVVAEAFGLDFSLVLNEKDHKNRSFLHIAADAGHSKQLIKISKKYGLNLNDALGMDEGDNFIHHAIRYKYLEQMPFFVKELNLDTSKIITNQNLNGDTVVDIALKNKSLKSLSNFFKETNLKLPMNHFKDDYILKALLNYDLASIADIFEHKIDVNIKTLEKRIPKEILFGSDANIFKTLCEAKVFSSIKELDNHLSKIPAHTQKKIMKNKSYKQAFAKEKIRLFNEYQKQALLKKNLIKRVSQKTV